LLAAAFNRKQRFAAPLAAYCSGLFLGRAFRCPSFTPSQKKMKAGKLISRWWWLIVVLLFSFTLIYFIWNTQRQVNALDKELQRPKNAQPNH
jgi:hypothetical protein